MHCGNCQSTELRIVGSVSNPTWECKRCGSKRPPLHEHDTPEKEKTDELLYEEEPEGEK